MLLRMRVCMRLVLAARARAEGVRVATYWVQGNVSVHKPLLKAVPKPP